MKFTAVGDIIIQRRIQEGFEGYEELAPFIRQGDASFFNLETTLNYEGECFASQFSGGTYIRTNPEVLDDIKKFGFNMTSFNNNHMLDFSYSGLLRTIEEVTKSGLVHSGVGRNLAEASAPHYLDTKNGRVALIAVNSTFEPSMMAGVQSERFPGRPGINGLRTEEYIQVTKEEMDFIKDLAERTNINAAKNITRKEGYYAELNEGEEELGKLKFVLGDSSKHVVKLNEKDMERVERAIYEAKLQADYIMISVHSHELDGDAKENPSDFLKEFAHRCIDAGANAIVGHGPHLLRPIEIYKDCPIFYSLGDFVLQLYDIEIAPDDFFTKHGLSSSASTVHDLLKKRSKNFTVGLMTDIRMYRTVIPYWETENGKLTRLSLLPVELVKEGHHSEIGLPRNAAAEEITKYLGDMSLPYGTAMKLEKDGTISCSWN